MNQDWEGPSSFAFDGFLLALIDFKLIREDYENR